MPQDQSGAPGAQHIHLILAVRAGEHAMHQRHHLATKSDAPGILYFSHTDSFN
jgi:hypothetical protein